MRKVIVTVWIAYQVSYCGRDRVRMQAFSTEEKAKDAVRSTLSDADGEWEIEELEFEEDS